MGGPIIECVPNFSEGTDSRRVEAIVAAMRVEGVHLLDWSMDADHNRSIVTIAGEPAAVLESAVRGDGKAGYVHMADWAISAAAPALIWWLSDVVCGSTRAM